MSLVSDSASRFRLIERLRHLHPPVVVMVRAAPGDCLQTLAQASRPSRERLHLRDLYTSGRRYYLEPRQDGFLLRSNTRILWGHSRARTPFAASVAGTFSLIGEGITSVRLHARGNWFYGLRGLLLPVSLGAIALSMPWPRALSLSAALLLPVLAWLGNRISAALEATEMMFFVQKALSDLPAADIPALDAAVPDVIPHDAFRDEWHKFYEQHKE
jgi:hypothetical protein